ncbi:TPA: hypothetical protein ACH3X3_014281 [Trebouxia sp. C0006]
MCKQVLDHQISKSSPLCTRLTRQRAQRQNSLITCRDSALLNKRFVVRRLLETCCVTTAADTHSLEQITDIFQLARLQASELPTSVSSIISLALGTAGCHVTPQLIQKFGLPEDASQAQTVVSVTNKITHQQAWFKARTQKPQLFQQPDILSDPTVAKQHCDFCNWQNYTASDSFGRTETTHTVTASNLFKYCEPCHGLVLFKHHHPLQFDQQQVAELLCTAHQWFAASQQAHPEAKYPFLLWNCLPRAGASQFHGHAQVMLSKVALPCHTQAAITESEMTAAGLGAVTYQASVLEAYMSLGLVTAVGPSHDRAYCYPSITPLKDMETVIHGTSLLSSAFAAAVHGVLRTLVDQLGVTTFNVGISGMAAIGNDLAADFQRGNTTTCTAPVIARIVSRGKLSSQASDFGGLEVFASASIGHTDPFVVSAALQKAMLKVDNAAANTA